MSMADDIEIWDAYADIAAWEDAEQKLLKSGKWITRDGRKINIFVAKECDDNHFGNICKMLVRNGCDESFADELRKKRAKKIKKQMRAFVTL